MKADWYNAASIHYIIKDQKLYRKSLGKIDGFKSFTDTILLSILRKITMPDVEFIFDLGDWPVSKNATDPLPIFSWCGSESTFDIAKLWKKYQQFLTLTLSRLLTLRLSLEFEFTEPVFWIFWEEKVITSYNDLTLKFYCGFCWTTIFVDFSNHFSEKDRAGNLSSQR